MLTSEELEGNSSSATVDQGFGEKACERDLLYLFACHLLWHRNGDLKAYQELVAALDDPNPRIRAVAQDLLHRSSPRPNQGQGADWEI